ncbi:MAG: GAF domain-containing protein [Chloroflexota bacterium]|nr:MAG: GAF domain-containing protein [Chloroflexota bacterium]
MLPTPYRPFSWPYFLGDLADLALYGTGIYAQIYRYRYISNPGERLQTKWVVFGMAVAYLGLYAYYLPQLFLPTLQEPSLITFRYRIVGQPLAYLAMLILPVAFTFSILRYRLYDIDIILNRTLVYVPLTGILAGLYSASIALSQRLFIAATGEKSDAAVVLTTLVLASAFTPIKNSLQSKVDVRFKEAPDPSKKMKAFAEGVVSRIFYVDPREITRKMLEEAIQAFEAKSGAVYWRKSGELELLHASREWDGDARFSVPLIAREGDAILGLISLSRRRNGSEYTDRDRRALEEAAHEVAQAIEQDRKPMEPL